MSVWITTHWPTPGMSRHVYVTDRNRTVPSCGDLVFVYESETARGRSVVDCVHRGDREPIKIPTGAGGIIYEMVVRGTARRAICDEDVVYDFGNLDEWRIIECDQPPKPTPFLSRADLMRSIGHKPETPPRFLRLWRVPIAFVPALLAKVGGR